MLYRMKQAARCCAWGFLSLLAGCVTVTDPTLYLLTSQPGAVLAVQTPKQPLLVLGLELVELPKYLKGQRIVLQKTSHELEMAKGQRWAEPLTDNFSRVLASNLAQRLGLEQVYLYPRQTPPHTDLLVKVLVNHFIGSPTTGVTLDAHWSLRNPTQPEAPVPSNHTVLHQATAALPTDTQVMVATMSDLIAQLADQIATDVRRVWYK